MSSKSNYKSNTKGPNGGRGRFRSKGFTGNYNQGNSYKKGKKELKFTPLDSGSPQATYMQVMEVLENHLVIEIDKGGRDVANSIAAASIQLPEKPKLEISTETDAAKKAAEDRANELDYLEDKKLWNKRKSQLEDGLNKAYSIIWTDYMTETMRTRIEQHPDYLSKIKGDSVELIKAIKSSMHETTRAQKPTLSAIQAITKLFTYKQQDQPLGDYIKVFKEHRDVLITQLGEHMFDHFAATQTVDYSNKTVDERKKIRKDTFDEMLGTLLIVNSDQRRYKGLQSDLSAGFTRGRDEYPGNLHAAIDMLDNHKPEYSHKENKKKSSGESKGEKNMKSEKSFAQKKKDGPVVCFCCGSPDHKSNDCEFEKRIPKSEWFNKTGKVPKKGFSCKIPCTDGGIRRRIRSINRCRRRKFGGKLEKFKKFKECLAKEKSKEWTWTWKSQGWMEQFRGK
jgi:hypothetical protein